MNKRQKAEKLYYTYRNVMFREAFDILEDTALAEDAVSEAFVHIIKNLDKIECDNSFRTENFLRTICHNVAIDIYRKQKCINSHFPKSDKEPSFDNTPENILIGKESMQSIKEIIKSMPPIYRDTLLLSKVYHISRAEIAEYFGISPEAVTKRLQRAKTEIKQQLKKEEE